MTKKTKSRRQGLLIGVIIAASTAITVGSLEFLSNPHNLVETKRGFRQKISLTVAVLQEEQNHAEIQALIPKVFCEIPNGDFIVRGSKADQLKLLRLLNQGAQVEAIRPFGSLNRINEYQRLRDLFNRSISGELESSSDFKLDREKCLLLPYPASNNSLPGFIVRSEDRTSRRIGLG